MDYLRYACAGLIGAIITAFGLGAEYQLAAFFHSGGILALILIAPLTALAWLELRA